MVDTFVINGLVQVPETTKTVEVPAKLDEFGNELEGPTTQEVVDQPAHHKANVTFTFDFGKKTIQINHPIASTDPKTGAVVLTDNLVDQEIDDLRVYTQELTNLPIDQKELLAKITEYAKEYRAGLELAHAILHPLVGKPQSV